MKKYKDPNGQTWDVEFWASAADNAVSCGSLIRNLAADLELAVAGWKARGEELAALRDYADTFDAWRDYAEAFEAYGNDLRQWMPTRREFGL
jgi:hypothetical protein